MADNMAIWNAVAETNPNHTKHVGQRGGFTAIGANYQIMRATETFGPIGVGWGYTAGDPVFHETLLFIPVTLWHGDRANTFGPIMGCEEWCDKNGRIDSDVSKKATTDAITKLLSQLGFNADVFLGRYDDQKYVDSLRDKYAPKPELIGPDDVTKIEILLEGNGIPVAELLRVGKLNKLTALPAEKVPGVMAWIERTIAAKRVTVDNISEVMQPSEIPRFLNEDNPINRDD